MTCSYSEEELQCYLDGELEGAEARALERHLAACPECEDLVHRLSEESLQLRRVLAIPEPSAAFVDRTLRALSEEQEPGSGFVGAGRRRAVRWKPVAAISAVAAALMCSMVLLVWESGPPPQPGPQSELGVVLPPGPHEAFSQLEEPRVLRDRGHLERLARFQGVIGTWPPGEKPAADNPRANFRRVFAECQEGDDFESLEECAAASGKPAVKYLQRQAAGRDPSRARLAVRVLGVLDPAVAVSPLLKAMRRPELRADALAALEDLDEAALPLLLEALEAGSRRKRKDVIEVLVVRGEQAALPQLERLAALEKLELRIMDRAPEVVDSAFLTELYRQRRESGVRDLARAAIEQLGGADSNGYQRN